MDKKLFVKHVHKNALIAVVKMTHRYALGLEMLVRELIAAKTYQPETTHQIRILSNKCLEALRVLRHAGIEIDKNATKKHLHRLRRCLGTLRDADIRMDEFQAYIRKRRLRKNDSLTGALQHAWSQSYVKTMYQLHKDWPEFRNSLGILRNQSKAWSSRGNQYSWKKRNDRRVSKQLEKWFQLADALFKNEKEFHLFRIQTKRLRYLLQCLLPQKLPTAQHDFVLLLEQFQQELGRYCDLNNIVAWLDSFQDSIGLFQGKPGKLVNSVDSWRKSCEQELQLNEKQLVRLRHKIANRAK
ncbi:MAG TPA: CHAD domain-containing protein [Gemmatales bacterium]|nr:CHAD domain-containing protein [Gemmatales bacterium]